MSEIKLTKSQQEFVESYNKNTLVSASAGSGKTSTMIAKLTDLIVNNNVSVKNLLVVTYTNSAASEMKQKLYNSLAQKIQTEEDDAKIAKISEAIDEMVNCDIGTLHGICKKIITSYFYVIEQDPTFVLLNEQQSTYLFDNAMNNIFNELISKHDECFYNLYKLYNKKRNLNNLKFIIKTLYNYLTSKVDYKTWVDGVVENCEKPNNKAEQYLLSYYKRFFTDFEKLLASLKNRCEELLPKYSDYVSSRLNFVLEIKNLCSYEQMFKLAGCYKFIAKPRGSIDVDMQELADEIKLVIDDFSAVYADFEKHVIAMNDLDYEEYSKILHQLFNVVESVKSEYSNIKKMQNSLDFSDLEHLTLQILDNNLVKTTLQEKYKYIFVDEYQDINQVQEEIINRLKSDANLFMIGDVKQSIYAFRLSSPEIFINKFNSFSKDGVKNQVINLNENFRSEENILQFANMVFNELITTNTIGIDYSKNSQLVAGKKKEKNKCVSLDIVDCPEVCESEVIVNKIGQLVSEGYNYKDIVILLRSKSELVNEIYMQLKKYNIPCEATYKTDLFKNAEILVVYHLLKLINNSFDDVAVATVLKSFIVGLNDNELADIRLINTEIPFYECIYEYMKTGKNEHIKHCLFELQEFLSEIRKKLHFEALIDVVNYIFKKYNIFNYYLSFIDGVEKVSNLKEFLRLISNDEFKYNLGQCLDYLDTIKKDGVVTLTLLNVSDSVKITTIHASKGLEYPVVILAETGKHFVLNKQTDEIIINDTLGVGLNCYNTKQRTVKSSVIKNACKLCNRKSEIDEEIRLFYVALTRAKNKLCIIGKYDCKNVDYRVRKNIYNLNSYLEFIIKSVPKKYINNFKNKIDNFTVCEGESCEFVVNFYKEPLLEYGLQSRNIVLNGGDIELQSILGEYFDFVYPFKTYSNIAVKNSVSQVLKEETDYENQVEKISLTNENDDYSLRLGTAYHTIMQNINYSENKAEISELINKVKTPDLPYEDINENKIVNAVNAVKSLLSPNSEIMKEKQFIMRANYGELTNSKNDVNVLIQGVIDLIIVNDNGAIVIDFKTNKTNNEQYLKDNYSLQLNMYANAFSKANNIKIYKKLLYSFYMDKFIEI